VRTRGHLAFSGGEAGDFSGGEAADGASTVGTAVPARPGPETSRPDAIEALLGQLRPAIVRYCRARLARTASQDAAEAGCQ